MTATPTSVSSAKVTSSPIPWPSAQLSPAVSQMRCPGVISDAARAQGALHEAEALSDQALTAGAGLGFGRHNFAISGLRTVALLALERHDLAAAAEVNERILGMLGGGRPAFDYLAQLDGLNLGGGRQTRRGPHLAAGGAAGPAQPAPRGQGVGRPVRRRFR